MIKINPSCLVCALLLFLALVSCQAQPASRRESKQPPVQQTPVTAQASNLAVPLPISVSATAATLAAPLAVTQPLNPPRGGLLLVLDDIGFNRERVKRVLSWNLPIVFAILPGQPYSQAIAAELATAKAAIFLHQPMEPLGFPKIHPGAQALLLGDSAEEWRRLLKHNLDALPMAVGLNNHMGSRFSQTASAAVVVASVAAERNLVLLDSLTTPKSKLYTACKQVGGRCLARDIFLDDELSAEAIDAQIDAWLHLAQKRGAAIAIGHPGRLTIERLEAVLPRIDSLGLKFVSYEWMLRWQNQREQQ